jgi:hypothetical protein
MGDDCKAGRRRCWARNCSVSLADNMEPDERYAAMKKTTKAGLDTWAALE